MTHIFFTVTSLHEFNFFLYALWDINGKFFHLVLKEVGAEGGGGGVIITPTSPLYHVSMCVHVFSNVCLYQGTNLKRRNEK